ncbi:type II toxin-antitoxin system prevent-host-death family antitoxin [Mucilaginibacter sp. SMC90]|uniref:type II toxin-antitoxin system Phd/YefM family antitoxin n=1 Tax=Mucilaginibacter sp. SMC90 TaxID=2929803 RepID=UPI001FB28995|nr:type II toxin-antitoxin system prevent-host-death family antitoxin [Mucilaginibacter sp. SMC90]UOE49747.1 type II toxin-antitoxin system prevent-host-death family antitoxin [Mucilaginibacter sp. SMC90]
MEAISIKLFKKNIKSYLDKVCADRKPLVVTDISHGDIVILPKAEYDSMEETFYLLKSPGNAARLLHGTEEYKQNK